MKKILGLSLMGLILFGWSNAQGLDRERLRAEIQREVLRDQQHNFNRSDLSLEGRNSDYELGKTVIDVLGRRVRIEEYVLRPEPNVFRYLLLNRRAERLDYLSKRYEFAKSLPLDLRDVTRRDIWKPMGWNAADKGWDNWLIYFHQRASNSFDYVDWELKAVKPIGIENIEPDYSGKLNYIYTYSVGNPEVGNHIKERLELWSGGKHEYAGGEPPKRSWFNSPTVAYDAYGKIYAGVEVNGNSKKKTFIAYEQFIIDDFGHIQSRHHRLSNISSNNDFPSDGGSGLPLNREVIITATEFGGRTIDLVRPMRVMTIQPEPVKEVTATLTAVER